MSARRTQSRGRRLSGLAAAVRANRIALGLPVAPLATPPAGTLVCDKCGERGHAYAKAGDTHYRVRRDRTGAARTANTCGTLGPVRAAARCACCERGDEYNGFGSDGPCLFRCANSCACHD